MKRAAQILVGVLVLMAVAFVLLPGGNGGRSLPVAQRGLSAGVRSDGDPVPDLWVSKPVTPVLSRPVRELPTARPEFMLEREINPRLSLNATGLSDYAGGLPGGVDSLLDVQASVRAAVTDSGFLTPTMSFAGHSFTYVNPPDTEGDVGPDYYIQVVNGGGGGLFTVYDKTSGEISAGPTAIDSLAGTESCAAGYGDGIILYDWLANRWMLSEFADVGNHLCVYVSQSADPTGAWYAYDFTTPKFPDYPKYAVWPDAFYVSTNETTGPAVYALDRVKMLAGQAATMIRRTAPKLDGFGFQALTPGDLDGMTPPPAGAPNYFMRHRDDEVHNPGANNPNGDYLEVWSFHADFAVPENSTFLKLVDIEVAEFDSELCGLSSFACFPQPGTVTTLDPLREVIMWRLVYRNFGDHETLLGNLVTDVDNTDHGGVRWFELRKSDGDWGLFQEGTFAPDSDNRWLGSIAMDGSGNVALGYSVASSSLYPSARYAGRLDSDPLHALPQGEVSIVSGTGSNASNRWGDYSSMHVDPVDDCTFWYTNMYSPGSQWKTWIVAFRFDDCGTPGFTLEVAPLDQSVCVPASAEFQVALDSVAGFATPVTLGVRGAPAGSTVSFSANPVTPTGSSLLTVDGTGDALPGRYVLDFVGVAPTLIHTATVTLGLFAGVPEQVLLSSPVNGAPHQPAQPTLRWEPLDSANAYDLEISRDAVFGDVVESAVGIESTSYVPVAPLDYNTVYYWRVRASNACGSGEFSVPWRFGTIDVQCAVFSSSDVPKTIPTQGSVVSSLLVPEQGALVDVNVVGLVGMHSWVGDLTFGLRSPAGIIVRLLDAVCGGADNFDLNLEDEAPAGSVPCPPVGGGTYQPVWPLAGLDGENSGGTWRLSVVDSLSPDGGELQGWGLEICSAVDIIEADLAVTAAFEPNPVWFAEPLTLTLNVENQGPSDTGRVVISSTFSAAVQLVSVQTTQGACEWPADAVACSLGVVPAFSGATVEVVLRPLHVGPLDASALVSAALSDPDASNNQHTAVANVQGLQFWLPGVFGP